MTLVAGTEHKRWLSPKFLGLTITTVAIFAAVQANSIASFVSRWADSPEFSHGFFIPLVSLWLAWERRDAVIAAQVRPSYAGVAIILLASFILLIGEVTDTTIFNHISFIVGIVGLVYTVGGWRLTRIMAVPLFFLLFMIPWPYLITAIVTAQLQIVSSELGVAIIRAFDIPAYLDGNVIDLGFYKLGVVEACSGLRYLIPILGLGFIGVYFYRGPLWHKIAVMAIILPLTIAMNSFRIAMIGVIAQFLGIDYAEGFLHYFEGWTVFLLILGIIYLFMVALAMSCRMSKPWTPMHLPDYPVKQNNSASGKAAWSPAPLVLSLTVMVVTVFFTNAVNARLLELPERSQLIGLPYDIAPTSVKILPLERAVEDVLNADDYVVANINSGTPQSVNLYVAYLDSQRDDRGWHSPQQCIPGGGWEIVEHTIEQTELSDGTFEYNRLTIQKNDIRQLVYYWYQQRGRSMASEWSVKFYLVYDAIFQGRTDGAMVRLLTPFFPNEAPEAADDRLMAYVDKVKMTLPKYVPD